MKASKFAAGVILPFLVLAQASSADAAPASAAAAGQLGLLIGAQAATVQTVHCRTFVHVHRRCTLWRGGVCRRWVKYRHRCG